MYGVAIMLSVATTAATTGLPYFHLGSIDVGIPIQSFGMIVAAGVLIGASLLRRYAEWHGVSDDHIRGLTGWVMVAGFLGAHEFDMLAYQWDKIGNPEIVQPASWWPLGEALWPSNWPLPLKIWDGISSYGGFIGGALGWWIYVWWKRLPMRLFADITIVGLLPAFSIGRIGCTVVSDHIGAAVDPDKWYAFLAMDYPRSANLGHLAEIYPGTSEFIRAWNLGLVEFLYLIPVNAVVLWLAFRASKRMPAGYLTVLAGIMYAPVRFFLDFLRPEDTDPRYFALTFAQWASILAFTGAVYVAARILKTGKPAETVTRTSREAQERLKVILKEDADTQQRAAEDEKAAAERKKAEKERLKAEAAKEAEDAALAKEALAAKPAEPATAGESEAEADDDDDAAADDEPAAAAEAAKPATPRPAAAKPGTNRPGAPKAKKKRKR